MRIRRFFLPALAVLCTILGGHSRARAALVQLSFEELTKRSKYVVTGEVVELRSYMAPFKGGGECMFTDVKIRVETILKGKPAAKEITVQVLGGQIGDAWQICFEAPRYQQGEKVLVFLRDENGKLWNTGWLQGKYPMLQDQRGISLVRGKSTLPIAGDIPLATIRDQVQLYSASAAVPPASGGSAAGRADAGGKEGNK